GPPPGPYQGLQVDPLQDLEVDPLQDLGGELQARPSGTLPGAAGGPPQDLEGCLLEALASKDEIADIERAADMLAGRDTKMTLETAQAHLCMAQELVSILRGSGAQQWHELHPEAPEAVEATETTGFGGFGFGFGMFQSPQAADGDPVSLFQQYSVLEPSGAEDPATAPIPCLVARRPLSHA
ncbi:hypothetical protein CYMTET_34934, partial [Cymbomonas tetramitiformis]